MHAFIRLDVLEVQSIQTRPIAGATLEECQREAAMLSLQQHADVEFTHSGVEYIIGYEQLIERVKPLK